MSLPLTGVDDVATDQVTPTSLDPAANGDNDTATTSIEEDLVATLQSPKDPYTISRLFLYRLAKCSFSADVAGQVTAGMEAYWQAAGLDACNASFELWAWVRSQLRGCEQFEDRWVEDDQGDAQLAVKQHGSIGPCVLSRYYFDDDDGVEHSIHGFQIALACILKAQPKLITAFRRGMALMSSSAASRAGPCVQDDLDAAEVEFEDALSSEGQGLFWVSLLGKALVGSTAGLDGFQDRMMGYKQGTSGNDVYRTADDAERKRLGKNYVFTGSVLADFSLLNVTLAGEQAHLTHASLAYAAETLCIALFGTLDPAIGYNRDLYHDSIKVPFENGGKVWEAEAADVFSVWEEVEKYSLERLKSIPSCAKSSRGGDKFWNKLAEMIPSWKGTSRQLYDEMRTIDKAAKCIGLGLPRLPDDCWAQKLRLDNVKVRGGDNGGGEDDGDDRGELDDDSGPSGSDQATEVDVDMDTDNNMHHSRAPDSPAAGASKDDDEFRLESASESSEKDEGLSEADDDSDESQPVHQQAAPLGPAARLDNTSTRLADTTEAERAAALALEERAAREAAFYPTPNSLADLGEEEDELIAEFLDGAGRLDYLRRSDVHKRMADMYK